MENGRLVDVCERVEGVGYGGGEVFKETER